MSRVLRLYFSSTKDDSSSTNSDSSSLSSYQNLLVPEQDFSFPCGPFHPIFDKAICSRRLDSSNLFAFDLHISNNFNALLQLYSHLKEDPPPCKSATQEEKQRVVDTYLSKYFQIWFGVMVPVVELLQSVFEQTSDLASQERIDLVDGVFRASLSKSKSKSECDSLSKPFEDLQSLHQHFVLWIIKRRSQSRNSERLELHVVLLLRLAQDVLTMQRHWRDYVKNGRYPSMLQCYFQTPVPVPSNERPLPRLRKQHAQHVPDLYTPHLRVETSNTASVCLTRTHLEYGLKRVDWHRSRSCSFSSIETVTPLSSEALTPESSIHEGSLFARATPCPHPQPKQMEDRGTSRLKRLAGEKLSLSLGKLPAPEFGAVPTGLRSVPALELNKLVHLTGPLTAAVDAPRTPGGTLLLGSDIFRFKAKSDWPLFTDNGTPNANESVSSTTPSLPLPVSHLQRTASPRSQGRITPQQHFPSQQRPYSGTIPSSLSGSPSRSLASSADRALGPISHSSHLSHSPLTLEYSDQDPIRDRDREMDNPIANLSAGSPARNGIDDLSFSLRNVSLGAYPSEAGYFGTNHSAQVSNGTTPAATAPVGTPGGQYSSRGFQSPSGLYTTQLSQNQQSQTSQQQSHNQRNQWPDYSNSTTQRENYSYSPVNVTFPFGYDLGQGQNGAQSQSHSPQATQQQLLMSVGLLGRNGEMVGLPTYGAGSIPGNVNVAPGSVYGGYYLGGPAVSVPTMSPMNLGSTSAGYNVGMRGVGNVSHASMGGYNMNGGYVDAPLPSGRGMNQQNLNGYGMSVAGNGSSMGGFAMNGSISNEGRPVRSMLLEEFRANRNRGWELMDLADHIVEFSGDQLGSRHIQSKLETASSEEKAMVFEEILPNMLQLSTDVFANYVIQKFFELGNQAQKAALAKVLEGHVLELSFQIYGCRVVQKAIEHVLVEQQVRLVNELDGHILRCAQDPQSNHVIQRALERVPSDKLEFITSACRGHVYDLAIHPYGCRVLQRIFENCIPAQSRVLLDELHRANPKLIQDPYGNYVIQWIIEKGDRTDKTQLINKIYGSVIQLSQQKYASNVVEKCIVHGTDEERRRLIEEVLDMGPDGSLMIKTMLTHPFANYVMQKMLIHATGQQREALYTETAAQLASLRKYSASSSKHLVAIEKLLSSGRRMY